MGGGFETVSGCFIDYRDHEGARPDKFHKATLCQGQHLMLGLNCLEPGQSHAVHTHPDQDKIYVVMEGRGWFTVGDELREAAAGMVIWAAAGVPHGVENRDATRLSILVGMSPPPPGKARA